VTRRLRIFTFQLCLDFYPISQIIDLRVKVLTIKQESKESLALAWNRFTTLLASGPDLSLPDPILLQHFYKGLSRESRKLLDTTLGGSFLHVSSKKARLILDQIQSTELDYLLEVEPQPLKPTLCQTHHLLQLTHV